MDGRHADMHAYGQAAIHHTVCIRQAHPSSRHSLVLSDGAVGLAANGHQHIAAEHNACTAAGAGTDAVAALQHGPVKEAGAVHHWVGGIHLQSSTQRHIAGVGSGINSSCSSTRHRLRCWGLVWAREGVREGAPRKTPSDGDHLIDSR